MNKISVIIAEAAYQQGYDAYKLEEIINKKKSNIVKQCCNLSSKRIKDIIDGEWPTVIECMILGDVLGLGLGYFYSNAKW